MHLRSPRHTRSRPTAIIADVILLKRACFDEVTDGRPVTRTLRL